MANGINGIDEFLKLFYNSKADKNNDGVLDKKEGAGFLFSDEAKSAVSAFSAGKISDEELQNWIENSSQDFEKKQTIAEKISDFDTNNDGFIQLNEIQDGSDFDVLKNIFAGTQETFSVEEFMAYQNLVDTNNDGTISEDEKSKFGSLVSAEKVGSFTKAQMLSALKKSVHSEEDKGSDTDKEIFTLLQNQSIFNLEQKNINIQENQVVFLNKTIKLKTGEIAIENADGSVDILSKNKKTGIRYDSNGTKIGTLTKTYFTNGILKQEVLKKTDGSTVTKVFNSAGNITSETNKLKNGKVKKTATYSYNANGTLTSVKITNNDNNGKLSSIQQTTYSANGDKTVNSYNAKKQLTSSRVYYANGVAKSTTVNTYNSKGVKTKIVQNQYDMDGNKKLNYTRSFDSKGKLSSGTKYEYNSDGSYKITTQNKYGVASIKKYDSSKQLTYSATNTYDSKGKKTKNTVIEYENGKISKKEETNFNTKGVKTSSKTTNYYDGQVQDTLVNTYDAKGNRTKSTQTLYYEGVKYSVEITNYKNGKATDYVNTDYELGIIISGKYKYQGNSVIKDSTVRDFDKNFLGTIHEETILNEAGKEVSSYIETKDYIGEITSTEKITYEYDENGDLKYSDEEDYDVEKDIITNTRTEYDLNFIIKKEIKITNNKNKQNYVLVTEYENNMPSSQIKKFDFNGDGIFEQIEENNSFNYISEPLSYILNQPMPSILTERVKQDIEIVKNAEIAGLQAGEIDSEAYLQAYNASIKAQMIKTPENMENIAGEIVEKADGLYVNDGNSLVKLNISAETYLKLFPPIERYDIAQGGIGDCYFISGSLIDMMKNPVAYSQLLQMFSEDKGGNITVNFEGTLSNYPVTFEKGELKNVDGLVNGKKVKKYEQISGSTGILMLEQAYSIARFAEDSGKQVSSIDIDAAIPIIDEGGWQSQTYTEILGLESQLLYDVAEDLRRLWNLSQDENLPTDTETFLNQYAEAVNNGTMLMSVAFYSENDYYNIVSSHAYSIEKIDTENRVIYVTNPWYGGCTIALPLDEFMTLDKCFSTCNLV